MRKIVAAVTTALLLAAPVQSAFAGKKAAAHQHVEGTITVPQGGNAAASCVYRTHRVMLQTFGANGFVGYSFDVDPATIGKKFKLEAGDGVGLDISFYADAGELTNPTAAPANYPYETPGLGGESGTVPAGYPLAIVCMTEGVNGSFSYAAGKGVK